MKTSTTPIIPEKVETDMKEKENIRNIRILKVDGGFIADLSKNTVNIPGFSTGTQFSYIPNLIATRKDETDDDHEKVANCLFIEPAAENNDRGEYVYYVSNLNNNNI